MQTIFVNKPRTPRWVRVVEIGLAAAVLVLMYLFLTSCGCAAATTDLRGKVVGVLDGDTLILLDANRQEHRIRLAEIDAPEKDQAFGKQSKQSLANLCFGHEAVVEDRGRDRYDRVVGRVFCSGVDANSEQVRRGMAWVFDRYATDRTLYTLQTEAQAARRGLWNAPSPVPPWEWRKTAH